MSGVTKSDIHETEYKFARILTDPVEIELCLHHKLTRERIKRGDG